MKKQNVINLIKYHTEGNEPAFRSEAYTIAEDFVRSGDKQIGHYILTLLSDRLRRQSPHPDRIPGRTSPATQRVPALSSAVP